MWHAGVVSSIVTLQLQIPRFDPKFGLMSVQCSVFDVLPMFAQVSSGFSSFLTLSKYMQVGGLAMLDYP